MIAKTSRSWFWSPSVAAALACATVLATAPSARADEIQASPKGIIGGALLGGEVVLLGESAFGAKSGWAYAIGGLVGAGAGAFGGFEAEQNFDSKVSVYMLAGGMALVIPTVVAVLQATSYQVPDDYVEDRPAVGVPAAEPPQPSGPPFQPAAPAAPPATSPTPAAPPPPSAPSSSTRAPANPQSSLYLHYHWASGLPALPRLALLDLDDSGALSLSVPAVEVRPVYTPEQMQTFGVSQQRELRVPLLAGTF